MQYSMMTEMITNTAHTDATAHVGVSLSDRSPLPPPTAIRASSYSVVVWVGDGVEGITAFKKRPKGGKHSKVVPHMLPLLCKTIALSYCLCPAIVVACNAVRQ